MQPSFSNRNTNSNLIKSSAAAGKKARRRLIGSVFMLLVALIILLNVTAKTKPIPVNPKIIDIKRSAGNMATANHNVASATSATNSASSQIIDTRQNSSASISSTSPSQLTVSSKISASIPTNNTLTNQANAAESNNQSESGIAKTKLDIIPKVINENTKPSLSPEDILNGKTTSSTSNVYFVQFIASKNKENILKIKSELAKKGIKSFIQPIKTDNSTIYRLRAGPFKNKSTADKRLSEIKEAI